MQRPHEIYPITGEFYDSDFRTIAHENDGDDIFRLQKFWCEPWWQTQFHGVAASLPRTSIQLYVAPGKILQKWMFEDV